MNGVNEASTDQKAEVEAPTTEKKKKKKRKLEDAENGEW